MAGRAQTTMQCGRCRAEVPSDAAFCPRCGASTATGRAAGPVLVGFTILRVVGRGGAAVVYLARQDALDRRVAIKLLRRDVEDPKAWRRFRQEAQTIARLSSHPNVVTVYTAGRSEAGEPYIVTEYMDRGSLSDIIEAEGALPPARVAKIGVSVTDALTAAHAMGILHRDVKPANVFLDQLGRVKLGDFGIARMLGGQPITVTDVVAFTPEHVAPETVRGERDGPWSDVYSLASTLAACLVGRSLFAREDGERVDALLSRKLSAPAPALPDSVPRALADPITRALDPEPSRRPSLTELRRELAAAAAQLGATVSLPPPTPGTAARDVRSMTAPDRRDRIAPASGHRRWSPLAAFGVVLGAVVALVGLITAAVAVLGQPDAEPNTLAPLQTTPSQPTESSVATTPTTAELVAPVPTSPPPTAAPTTVVTTPITDQAVAPAPTPSPPSATAPTTTVTAPVPPPTTPPARPVAAQAPVLVTAEQAEAFVRSYYDLIAGGNYAASWSQLAPEFQRGKARSYEYYTSFWEKNDIEVGTVRLVEADRGHAIVNVELRWNGSRQTVLDQFTLRGGDTGEPLIAAQRTID